MKVTTDACLFGAWCAARLQHSAIENVLDVGTGTGLLSLMIAQKTAAFIDAVEKDGAAAKQAAENCSAPLFGKRISVLHADVRSMDFLKRYDAIACNPPFYKAELQSPNESKNLAHHGTALTLPDVVRLFAACLAPAGSAFLLLPPKRLPELYHLFKQYGFHIGELVFVQQTAAHAAFRVMLSGSRIQAAPGESSLIISETDGGYTPAFRALLQDYYLKL